jgi:hypothetical protein
MGKSKEINGLNDKMFGTFLTPKAVISESRILHLRLIDILLFFLFCFQAGGVLLLPHCADCEAFLVKCVQLWCLSAKIIEWSTSIDYISICLSASLPIGPSIYDICIHLSQASSNTLEVRCIKGLSVTKCKGWYTHTDLHIVINPALQPNSGVSGYWGFVLDLFLFVLCRQSILQSQT